MENQIFTIVDKVTGQEYRAQFEGEDLQDNEIAVPELRIEPMENPYFNFETREFYNKVIN